MCVMQMCRHIVKQFFAVIVIVTFEKTVSVQAL